MKYRLFSRSVGLVIYFSFLVSCSGSDDGLEPINNEYELDGEVFQIDSKMYWEYNAQSGLDQIRLLEALPDENLYDLILISPVPGPSSLEGDYVFSKTGDIGTYDLNFVHETDGVDDFLWNTNGENGEALKILFVGNKEGQEIYRILIPDFNLNYGYWDYLAGKWVSLGQKSFQLSYEGPIEEQ